MMYNFNVLPNISVLKVDIKTISSSYLYIYIHTHTLNLRVVRHWNRMLREAVDALRPWKHSRPGWMGLSASWSVGGVPAYSRGLELDDLKGPFQPKPLYASMNISSLFTSEDSYHQKN